MIEKRPSHARGTTEIGWLQSHHSFSFGAYNDRDRVSHGPLRVLNDDIIAGKKGFGEHPHRNAEIVSYILAGALEHRDSMGNGRIIQAGQFQYMSAGHGVTHSEFNPSDEPVHLLQIWLLPNEQNAEPTYAETDIIELGSGLQQIASSGEGAPIQWRSNAALWRGELQGEETIPLPSQGEKGYLHLTRGKVRIADETLSPGDALAVSQESGLSIHALESAEFLWFDLELSS